MSDQGRRGRLLVVDDEEAVGRSLQILLRREADVTVVTSTVAAIEVLGRDDAWDMILCDVTMPGGGGVGVYEWLAAHRPTLRPRLRLMSGGVTDGHSLAALRARGLATLEKPFDPPGLRALVTSALKGRRGS